MQIRLFRGLGEPVWVNALSSACERLGPDPRRALGPAATPAASTGRTRDRTRPMLQNVRKFLPGRRPHVTQGGHSISWMSPVKAVRSSVIHSRAWTDASARAHCNNCWHRSIVARGAVNGLRGGRARRTALRRANHLILEPQGTTNRPKWAISCPPAKMRRFTRYQVPPELSHGSHARGCANLVRTLRPLSPR